MTLKPCPFCESTSVRYYDVFGGHAGCESCGAIGPDNDTDGEKWNAVSRTVHEPIPATIESTESGAMPWRLQIAAQLWAGFFANPLYEYEGRADITKLIDLADALIAAHKSTEVE